MVQKSLDWLLGKMIIQHEWIADLFDRIYEAQFFENVLYDKAVIDWLARGWVDAEERLTEKVGEVVYSTINWEVVKNPPQLIYYEDAWYQGFKKTFLYAYEVERPLLAGQSSDCLPSPPYHFVLAKFDLSRQVKIVPLRYDSPSLPFTIKVLLRRLLPV